MAKMTVPENSIVVATNSMHGSKTHELLGSKSEPIVNSAWIQSVDCKMHDARKIVNKKGNGLFQHWVLDVIVVHTTSLQNYHKLRDVPLAHVATFT